MGDMKPVFEVVESPGGLYIGARRNAENGNYYWRVTQWVMPAFTMIPPRADHPVHGHFWVPIDDENCWAWSFDYKVDPADDGEGVPGACATARASTSHTCRAPSGPLANKDNDYLIDRAAQKRGETFSGVVGHRHAGCLAAGKHGPDRRPHQGEPGLHRQRHHHGAAPPAARAEGHGKGRDAARRRRSSISACARPRSCCRRTSPSRMPPRTRLSCRPGKSHATV